jgi:hypothetical protein
VKRTPIRGRVSVAPRFRRAWLSEHAEHEPGGAGLRYGRPIGPRSVRNGCGWCRRSASTRRILLRIPCPPHSVNSPAVDYPRATQHGDRPRENTARPSGIPRELAIWSRGGWVEVASAVLAGPGRPVRCTPAR